MQELQANTIATIMIGPFVDKGDGVTPEEGITLAAADSAEVMKHDGTTFVDIAGAGGNQATLTHKEKGMYTLAIPAAVLSDEGRLTVFISDESVCLPVWKDFMVLAQAAWISKYTAKDSGYMDVDIKAIGGTATPHTSGKLHVFDDAGASIPTVTQIQSEMEENGLSILDTLQDRLTATRAGYLDELDFGLTEAIAALLTQVDTTGVALLAAAVDDIWDEVITGADHNDATSAGRRLRTAGHDTSIARDNTCQAGEDASHVKLDSGASGTNNFYDHMWIYLVSGTGAGQVRLMDSYVGNTFVAEVHPDWLTNPDGTTDFTIHARAPTFTHDIETEGLASIQAELEENGASILDTLNDKLPGAQKG